MDFDQRYIMYFVLLSQDFLFCILKLLDFIEKVYILLVNAAIDFDNR